MLLALNVLMYTYCAAFLTFGLFFWSQWCSSFLGCIGNEELGVKALCVAKRNVPNFSPVASYLTYSKVAARDTPPIGPRGQPEAMVVHYLS